MGKFDSDQPGYSSCPTGTIFWRTAHGFIISHPQQLPAGVLARQPLGLLVRLRPTSRAHHRAIRRLLDVALPVVCSVARVGFRLQSSLAWRRKLTLVALTAATGRGVPYN